MSRLAKRVGRVEDKGDGRLPAPPLLVTIRQDAKVDDDGNQLSGAHIRLIGGPAGRPIDVRLTEEEYALWKAEGKSWDALARHASARPFRMSR